MAFKYAIIPIILTLYLTPSLYKMPELPEIETVKRGIKALEGNTIDHAIVRNPRLRYEIDPTLPKILAHTTIKSINRRAKYLILNLTKNNHSGYLIIHLGMSGSLGITHETNIKKHDHVDIVFSDGVILRYNDPRRFGCVMYTENLEDHPLLGHLGPEPLTTRFNTSYLLSKLKNKTSTIKQLIMDNTIVVGVGNIYACESLFLSKISPLRLGKDITQSEATLLVKSIKDVLAIAIELGGSSLRDYKQADGSLGYFQNVHNVYGRASKECKVCSSSILEKRLGQRNSFYCNNCQK